VAGSPPSLVGLRCRRRRSSSSFVVVQSLSDVTILSGCRRSAVPFVCSLSEMTTFPFLSFSRLFLSIVLIK